MTTFSASHGESRVSGDQVRHVWVPGKVRKEWSHVRSSLLTTARGGVAESRTDPTGTRSHRADRGDTRREGGGAGVSVAQHSPAGVEGGGSGSTAEVGTTLKGKSQVLGGTVAGVRRRGASGGRSLLFRLKLG